MRSICGWLLVGRNLIKSKNNSERGCSIAVMSACVIPWSSDTDWIIAQGSIQASVTVESSVCPVDESDVVCNSPLVLKPRGPDSGPCEIKIHFEQKYETSQIYVRSTARVYEVYYSRSSSSGNEYLCTVRCCVAERDGEILQTSCIKELEGTGDCLSRELSEESVIVGEISVTSEDDWVNVKGPEGVKSYLPDNTGVNRTESMQDLYEATAQISDAEPCLSLTIRLLSLQDKGQVYIDEVYVFVDPAESSDSGNEAAMAGGSTQNSLMAMFVPALLQLSKSGVRGGQDSHTFDKVIKDDKLDIGSRRIDQIDTGLQKNESQSVELKVNKNASESSEHLQSTVANCSEPINNNDLPAGKIEGALEQLISRVSRVEDVLLRFEEKMLKPIESIEARLQKVELQLEKLALNSLYSGLPNGTRISAPAFSCTESNSSSFYNDRSDYPPCGESGLEKRVLSCNDTPELPESHGAKFQPGLVISAPSFTCGEDEEENADLPTLEDSNCIKPKKKTVSVDDALAAALDGFLSTAAILPSEHIQTSSSLSSKAGEVNQYQELGETFEIAENAGRKSTRYTKILTVRAPDFTDEMGNEDDLSRTQSPLDMPSETKNAEKVHDETASDIIQTESAFAEPYDASINKSAPDFESESIVDSCAVSVACLDSRHSNESSELNAKAGSCEEGIGCDCPEVDNETGHKNTDHIKPDDEGINLKQFLEHDSENTSEPVQNGDNDVTTCTSESAHSPVLDLDFPILDVKFTPDIHIHSNASRSSLEALLSGAADSNTEAHSVSNHNDVDGSTTPGPEDNGMLDPWPFGPLLVDINVPGIEVSSSLEEDGCHGLCTLLSPQMEVSLI